MKSKIQIGDLVKLNDYGRRLWDDLLSGFGIVIGKSKVKTKSFYVFCCKEQTVIDFNELFIVKVETFNENI